MTIENKPFVKYNEDKADTFTLRFNKEERAELEEDKKVLQQLKDGTATKQLMRIGRNVLHSSSTGEALKIVLENRRKNKDRGIVDFD